MKWKTGVHTIEVQTDKQTQLARMPDEYRGAIEPLKNRRYKINIPRLPGMQEYNGISETEHAIADVCQQMELAGGQRAAVRRIDIRLDDYRRSYEESLPVMRLLVYTIAHKYGFYGRRWDTSQGIGGLPLSVRAMPDESDDTAQRGIEYYNKRAQLGNESQGLARLELRRMNLNKDRLSYVVKLWRDELAAITKADYAAMIEAHAAELTERFHHQDETTGRMIARLRCYVMSREEVAALYRLQQNQEQRRKELLNGLPSWRELEQLIHDVNINITLF